jgi:iron complex transport system substrate-binding protein
VMGLRRFTRHVLAALTLLGAPLAQAQSAAPTYASLNMCTDQLLLDLADRSRIVGLSPFARDAVRAWPEMPLGDIPILSGTAEEVMLLRPSLVLAGRFAKRMTRDFIQARGIPLIELDFVRSLAQVRAQIAQVGALVGGEDKARARIAELDAAIARLRAAGTRHGLRILPLARRGWASGPDSLVSDILTTAGLGNAAADAGLRAGGFLSLEAVVKLRPDAVLVARADDRAEDQGRAMLLHPAIQSLFPPERRIVLPESLTVCGGPMLIAAMDQLAAQLERLTPRLAGGR